MLRIYYKEKPTLENQMQAEANPMKIRRNKKYLGEFPSFNFLFHSKNKKLDLVFLENIH